MEHQAEIRFDDEFGIYYICSCGYEKELGFSTTIEEILETQREHLSSVIAPG